MEAIYNPYEGELTIPFRFPLDELAERVAARRAERRKRNRRSLVYPWETDTFLAALAIRVRLMQKRKRMEISFVDLAASIYPPYFLAYVLALGCGITWCHVCEQTYHARDLAVHDWYQSSSGEDFCCPHGHVVYYTFTRFGPADENPPPLVRVKREEHV